MYPLQTFCVRQKAVILGCLFMCVHETVTKLNIICNNALFFGFIWHFFFSEMFSFRKMYFPGPVA